MTPQIVPMTEADVDAVVAIESAASSKPWTAGVFVDELTQTATRSYEVARIDDIVVGFCGLLVVLDEGHITNIAVATRARRAKVASRLMLSAFDEAARRRVRAITLEVRASNAAAQRLYHQFGFVPAGVRRRYYDDNGEDAIVMWTEAIAGAAMVARLDMIKQTVLHQLGDVPA